VVFGLSSYGTPLYTKSNANKRWIINTFLHLNIAIAPAIFQYSSELFYPVNEIIPTGYLFTIGNIGGVLLVAMMGWSENMDIQFTMRLPMLCLTVVIFIGSYFMFQINGVLKRTAQQHLA
jgi:hypothetical protein